jgi:uncharacterized membrane protein YedE/YeeE
METAFTPFASLAGGILIGVSAVLLMLVSGRIMGATGILAGGIWGPARDWRLALLAGMVSGPLALLAVSGSFPTIEVPVSMVAMIVGGVLVGIGVTFGGGCTSGHGVCGMARLSSRSIAATLTFMLTTGITVYVVRHLLGG